MVLQVVLPVALQVVLQVALLVVLQARQALEEADLLVFLEQPGDDSAILQEEVLQVVLQGEGAPLVVLRCHRKVGILQVRQEEVVLRNL